MSWLVGITQMVTFYVLLCLLALMSLLWNTIALVLYPLLAKSAGLRIGRMGIAHGYRTFFLLAGLTGVIRLDASALDALREEPGGLIIAANHPSLLDAMLLVSHLPRAVCIMKASLMRNIFLGAGARLARYIGNDSPLSMVRQAVKDLRRGGQLVIFPEGTRTTTPPVNEFLPGTTLIAKLAQAPIQIVYIETTSPYLGKGWPLWRMPPFPIRFHARLGDRLQPEADHVAFTTSLRHHFIIELAGGSGRPAREGAGGA